MKAIPGTRLVQALFGAVLIIAAACAKAPRAEAQAIPPSVPQPPLPTPVASVPMRLIAGKFVVQATLDGHGPFNIAIDSGAETLIITPHVARACRFPLIHGTVAVTGTQGGAPLTVAQARVGVVRIGGASVANPFCTVSPTPLSVDGYIGAPLLNAFVTEIDPQAGMVRLYRPDSFASIPPDGAAADDDAAARAEAEAQARALGQSAAKSGAGVGMVVVQSDGTPIAPDPNLPAPSGAPNPTPKALHASRRRAVMNRFGVQIAITLGFHRVPVAKGTLGGVPARLEIDTGSSFLAEFTAPFVRARNLAQRFDRIGSVQLISSGVVGRAGIYAFDDLTLGVLPAAAGQTGSDADATGDQSGVRLMGTVPTLFLASDGIGSGPGHEREPQYDGRVGAPLLAQFAMTFDYARSRLFLRPIPPSEVVLPPIAQSPAGF